MRADQVCVSVSVSVSVSLSVSLSLSVTESVSVSCLGVGLCLCLFGMCRRQKGSERRAKKSKLRRNYPHNRSFRCGDLCACVHVFVCLCTCVRECVFAHRRLCVAQLTHASLGLAQTRRTSAQVPRTTAPPLAPWQAPASSHRLPYRDFACP